MNEKDHKTATLKYLWEQGDTIAEMASVTGLSRGAVRKRLKRAQLHRVGEKTTPPTDWTPKQEAELRELWGSGESGGAISKALGTTRSAVMGKVSRLGLQRRLKTGSTRYQLKKIAKPVVVVAKLVKKPVRKKQTNTLNRRIGIMELTLATCRWPEGDPKKSDFGYCGEHINPNPDPGVQHAVYCGRHHKLAHVAASGRVQQPV